MNYKDEVIHFIGGITPYFGRIQKSEHTNGPNWYRILDPCAVSTREDEEGNYHTQIVRIWGVEKLYRHYVDVYSPPSDPIEIRVLDQDGRLYKKYTEQLSRPDLNLIKAPSDGDVRAINKEKVN